jgi:hypothetical protein
METLCARANAAPYRSRPGPGPFAFTLGVWVTAGQGAADEV